MKKAIISNRIYMPADAKRQELLDKELTYTIPSYNPMEPPTIIKNMGRISDKLISVPVGRMDLIPDEFEISDKRTKVPEIFPEFKFELRDSQARVYNLVEDNAIINAFVSWGKTFTALAIAAKLGQKTLIVVHTLALRNQWEEEIEKTLGIKPGIIGSGKFNTEPMIVLSNVQTLSKKIKEVSQMFGTLIVDECLDYNSKITTKNGQKSIGTIVNNKEPHEVLSFNETKKIFEWKPILRWFKNPQKEDMIKFTFNNNSILKCTLNHTVYSYNKGKVKAEDLLEGDLVITNKSFKSSNILREKTKPLVLGMILGDGSLSTNNNSCRLRITHGEAQKEYLEYKRSILLDGFTSDLVEGKSGYKPDNLVYTTSSLSFYDLDNWRDQLYGSNSSKSYITKEIANLLTLDSWAIMYQDDGSISKKGLDVTFSFCELDKQSLKYLQDSLDKLFSIKGTQYIHKEYRYLRLNREESKIFIRKIEHRIHPSLEYKKGVLGTNKQFTPVNSINMFEDYTVLRVKDINFEKATGGFRYNIEVADNHNYLAGHKLVSNCHHTPAKTFANIIDKSTARYKIGLSGTLQRKDGKHVIFNDYFGFDVHQPPKENYITPRVVVVKSEVRFPDSAKIPWARRVNTVAYNEEYQHMVSMLASTYAAKGHKILVVSDRVQFLKRCADLTGNNAVCITGELDHVERETQLDKIKNGSADILYGSQSIFSEGISLNELSVLILGTPLNNEPLLIQLIGRVIRKLEGKQQPVILDIHLKGNTASKQAKARMGVYIKQGYEIQTIAT